MKLVIRRKIVPFLCLFLSLLMSCHLYASAFMDKSGLSGQAPDFSIESLDKGKLYTFNDFKGKSIIMFFFTTWCPYCVKKVPQLNLNQDTYKKQQIQLIVVNVGESRRKVKSFVEAKNLSLDVFLDTESKTAAKYGVVGVPTFVLIAPDGTVRYQGNELPQDYLKLLK